MCSGPVSRVWGTPRHYDLAHRGFRVPLLSLIRGGGVRISTPGKTVPYFCERAVSPRAGAATGGGGNDRVWISAFLAIPAR